MKKNALQRLLAVFCLAVLFASYLLLVLSEQQSPLPEDTTVQAEEAAPTLSRYGSTGSEVRQIQQKLKGWGYYTGEVDGIYGSQTVAAVKYFQRRNGLTVDGIAGPQTLAAMGIQSTSSGSSSASSGDVYLLARIISGEARGEPYLGQVAVGAVIMNRIRHSSFPNTLAGVIYQSGAFTAVVDGQFDQPIADSAYRAAREALAGHDPTGGCIYYYNPATATNQWIRTRPIVTVIGRHVFCK